MFDPAPAVATNIEARGADGVGGGLVALQSECATEHRHRQLAFLEQPHQPPEADSAAVFEHSLASEIAALDALVEAMRLGQAKLREPPRRPALRARSPPRSS